LKSAIRNPQSEMSETFILVPGRTAKQGVGISEGKFKEGYQNETQTLLVSPADMKRLELADGARVRLTSEWGQIEVKIAPAKGDELPPGLLFIAYGDLSSRLMGGDTHGSGMPTSKGIDVTLERVM
jgi:formylmethanofuran dehydrogenase subunit D